MAKFSTKSGIVPTAFAAIIALAVTGGCDRKIDEPAEPFESTAATPAMTEDQAVDTATAEAEAAADVAAAETPAPEEEPVDPTVAGADEAAAGAEAAMQDMAQ